MIGLFFDQRFGVFAYAPVLLSAFAGLIVMVQNRHNGGWVSSSCSC